MKTNLRMTCLAVAAAALLLPAPAALAQSAAPKGNANNGHRLFEKDGCYECHGYVGQGAGATGPRLAKTKLSFDAFLRQLRKPSSQMPPYEAVVLSDEMAADIYAYLHSLPAPVDMKTVKLPH